MVCALGKTHMRSPPHPPRLLEISPIAFETVPMFVWRDGPLLSALRGGSSSTSSFQASQWCDGLPWMYFDSRTFQCTAVFSFVSNWFLLSWQTHRVISGRKKSSRREETRLKWRCTVKFWSCTLVSRSLCLSIPLVTLKMRTAHLGFDVLSDAPGHLRTKRSSRSENARLKCLETRNEILRMYSDYWQICIDGSLCLPARLCLKLSPPPLLLHPHPSLLLRDSQLKKSEITVIQFGFKSGGDAEAPSTLVPCFIVSLLLLSTCLVLRLEACKPPCEAVTWKCQCGTCVSADLLAVLIFLWRSAPWLANDYLQATGNVVFLPDRLYCWYNYNNNKKSSLGEVKLYQTKRQALFWELRFIFLSMILPFLSCLEERD